MSKLTKRKFVVQEVMESVLPSDTQMIVQVTGGRGNNLHAVVNDKGVEFLVSMPTKFRKNIYIKRGDYLIISPIEEGNKVRGEIAHVLFKDHIHHIQDEGLWPDAFKYDQRKSTNYLEDELLPQYNSEEDDDEENGLAFKVHNANKSCQLYEQCSGEEEEDEEEEEGEEEEEEEEEDEEEGEEEESKEERLEVKDGDATSPEAGCDSGAGDCTQKVSAVAVTEDSSATTVK